MQAYLEVLFSVENDGFGFDFSVLDVHFVSAEHNWDVFTHSDQIPVPVGNIFVSNTGGNVKHDNGALTLVSKTSVTF